MSYVSVVVDFLDTRFEKAAALSPEDYSLIAEWEKQQIPLSLALSSMERSVPELEVQYAGSHMFEEINKRVIREFAAWLRSNDN